MIPVSEAAWQAPGWQDESARAVTDPAELAAILGLDPALYPDAATTGFRMRVPRPFIARMRHNDPSDPLLRQVMPTREELATVAGFTVDPLDEHSTAPVIKKYAGRALVIATGACAVHCRYCFRRHYPYADSRAPADGWRATLDSIAADTDCAEVILSGGDPLSLTDRRLAALVDGLTEIGHVRRLRIHTRQPVVLPTRVDDALTGWLGACGLQKVVVVHANHAAEIDDEVEAAFLRLRDCGAATLNQSVLLKGVNDSVGALAALSERLFETGVLPYYLHQLDRVAGAAHFMVDDDRARMLHAGLQARLPGYLVPRLVREIPGKPGKTLMSPPL